MKTKKILALLMMCSIIVMSALAGCGGNEGESSEQITNKNFDINDFGGLWCEENISWIEGGMLLDITTDDNILNIYCSFTQAAPNSRIAEIMAQIPFEEVKGNSIEIPYESDNWGNRGTIVITLNNGEMVCEVKDIVNPEDRTALWGFVEGKYTLTFNPDAYQELSYTMDDYYEVFPDEMTEDYTGTETEYDLSKASGILASSGLSEEEFKEMCIYINSEYAKANEYVYAAGYQYYQEHPEENTLLENYTKEWEDYLLYGKDSEEYDQYNSYDLDNSESLEEYLNRQIYGPKGAKILGNDAKEYLAQMREYPADYLNVPFLLKDFRVEDIYEYMYYNESYVLYGTPIIVVDYRDDVNYPNVLNKTYYDMYTIFQGTFVTDGGTVGLQFAVLSLEKSE